MPDAADTTSTPTQVRTPRQERSQASMERVLSATEKLLRTQLFEELTLQQILREARVSVGSFYGRFASKDALVACLHERYDARQAVLIQRVLAPERWAGRSLPERVRLLVRYALMLYRRLRGLLRALVIDWRLHPEGITASHRDHRDQFHARVVDVLVGDGSEVPHPDPREVGAFALLALGATCRDVLLTSAPDHPHPVPGLAPGDPRLEAQLVHMLTALLTTPPA